MRWKTKDGDVLNIKEMSDNHLINTIKFIKRNTDNYVEKMQTFYLTCTEPNGQMAQDCFDREFEEVMDLDSEELLENNSAYKTMLKELNRRNLSTTPLPDNKE